MSKHHTSKTKTDTHAEGKGEAAAGALVPEGPVIDGTPEPAPAPPAASPAEAAAAEIASLQDRLLRLQADFDNFRKRTARDRQETTLRANEDLLRELLPVADHFELGLQQAVKGGLDPAVRQGLQHVLDQFLAALGRFGLVPIAAVGQPSDPNVHESVALTPSAEFPRDVVVCEIRRGYKLGAQLLRAAQVVLSSGAAEAPAAGAAAATDDE